MGTVARRAVVLSAVVVLTLAAVGSTAAQDAAATRHQQVISANPFGLLLEWFNAEYERVIGPTTTAGVGGSYISESDDRYLNADLFLRYYPQGRPLDGWAFGAKVGITSVREGLDVGDRDAGTFFGFGFDVNRSWLLGANDNFYVGVGFGLKRLLGTSGETFGLEVIPTIRLVNIGFAF